MKVFVVHTTYLGLAHAFRTRIITLNNNIIQKGKQDLPQNSLPSVGLKKKKIIQNIFLLAYPSKQKLGIILENKMSEISSYQKMSTLKVVHLSLFRILNE